MYIFVEKSKKFKIYFSLHKVLSLVYSFLMLSENGLGRNMYSHRLTFNNTPTFAKGNLNIHFICIRISPTVIKTTIYPRRCLQISPAASVFLSLTAAR